MTNEQVARVYDTLLCIPGMNDQIKLDFKTNRINILLLSQLVETGLKEEIKNPAGIITVSGTISDDVLDLVKHFLDKSGLTVLKEKMKAL